MPIPSLPLARPREDERNRILDADAEADTGSKDLRGGRCARTMMFRTDHQGMLIVLPTCDIIYLLLEKRTRKVPPSSSCEACVACVALLHTTAVGSSTSSFSASAKHLTVTRISYLQPFVGLTCCSSRNKSGRWKLELHDAARTPNP